MAPLANHEAIDFYDLLAIPATASESDIRRAYRKTSLLYHPDKVVPTPETLDKFQLLQTALAVLTDAAEKAKYDQGREAKQRRKAENDALESRRKKMKEDLERKETTGSIPNVNGTTKRTWSERDLEIKRIAEENRRRKEAATTKRMEDLKAAEVKQEEPQSDTIQRSVKVRWIKEGDGLDIDDQELTMMFPVGDVENVIVLKDKKRKLEGREKKSVLGTAVIVFNKLATAKKVVARGKTDELESVEWAAASKESDPT